MADPTGIVLNFFLDYTKDYIQYNVDLIGGANDNVQNLLNDLTALNAFVKNCTKDYADDEYLENLANIINDVISQAEDVAEQFVVCTARHKNKRTINKFLHPFEYVENLRGIGKECLQVKKKINELNRDKVPNALKAMEVARAAGSQRKKRNFMVEDRIIGFEDVADDVKKLLTGQSEELEVYSIVGILGLGKTTLARKVYDDPEIKYKFFGRAFVNVSEVYTRKEVFLRILEQVAGSMTTEEMSKISEMSESAIRDKIQEKILGKRYLIVLDDVWKKSDWDALKEVFPRNQKRSRVLITTRYSRVARHANESVEPYQLRYMTDEERKALLRWKVFGVDGCPEDLERHIKNYETSILHRSGGLPLAIVVIAGIILDRKFLPEKWKDVADRVENYDHTIEEKSVELIRLSFDSLPYYMKPCFLYLGAFPEDLDIPVWKLLRLWIAEGFVHGNGNVEDIAEGYLEELVDRNLVMVAKQRQNGKIKKCRVHDFLRKFCKEEARKKNIFQEMEGSSPINKQLSPEAYLRVGVNSKVREYVTSMPSGNRVRTFLSFPKEETELPPELISIIPKAFNLLRVLDVRAITFASFPAEVYFLFLLKYLALSCDFTVLNKKLANLWNLQTLIIETKARSFRIDSNLWQMEQFRHLHVNTSTCLLEVEEEVSKARVQTLSTIAPESCTRELFARSKQLQKLGIRGKLAQFVHPKNGPGLYNHLPLLESLENLKLLNDEVGAKLYSLPDFTEFPNTLSRLTLWNTSLDWKCISVLGKLENLKVLKLKDNAFVGQFWEIKEKDEGFPSLMVLHIGKTNLLQWTASAAHFASLTTLILKNCTDLQGIPRDFVDIRSFLRIDLHWTSPAVVSSANSIKTLKLEMQNKKKEKTPGFKLGVYPPEA